MNTNGKQKTGLCMFRRNAGMLFILLLIQGVQGISAQAQNFGTLFTTLEERDYLDYLRQDMVNRSQLATFNIQEDAVPDIPVVEEAEEITEAVVNYRFGGIIATRNGSNNIWLNGGLRAERDLPAGISLVNSADGTLLNIRADGNSYLLKPGQSIDTRSGTIREGLQAATLAPAQSQTADNTQAETDTTTVAVNDAPAVNASAEDDSADATNQASAEEETGQATAEGVNDEEALDPDSPEFQNILELIEQLQERVDAAQ